MGARASDWDLSVRLFSARLPWGWVSGGQDRREDESVSPDRAGDSGRRLVQKWQAGLNTVFFFSIWNYNPKGAGAMVGKGLQDQQVQRTRSGKKRWGVWAAVPTRTLPVSLWPGQALMSSRAGGGLVATAFAFGVPVVSK